MMSLLFVLFLISIVLSLMNQEKACFIAYGVAMIVSIFWFHHHATSTLAIQL